MAHSQTDAELTKSIALPNAGNTVNTNSIDLGTTKPFPTSEEFDVKISTTSGVGANNKNVTVWLAGSSEAAANFSNITEVAAIVINEETSAYAATSSTFKLPPGFAKRYIRASASGEANGGDASNGTLTIKLLL